MTDFDELNNILGTPKAAKPTKANKTKPAKRGRVYTTQRTPNYAASATLTTTATPEEVTPVSSPATPPTSEPVKETIMNEQTTTESLVDAVADAMGSVIEASLAGEVVVRDVSGCFKEIPSERNWAQITDLAKTLIFGKELQEVPLFTDKARMLDSTLSQYDRANAIVNLMRYLGAATVSCKFSRHENRSVLNMGFSFEALTLTAVNNEGVITFDIGVTENGEFFEAIKAEMDGEFFTSTTDVDTVIIVLDAVFVKLHEILRRPV